jgi:hypothetical protein
MNKRDKEIIYFILSKIDFIDKLSPKDEIFLNLMIGLYPKEVKDIFENVELIPKEQREKEYYKDVWGIE